MKNIRFYAGVVEGDLKRHKMYIFQKHDLQSFVKIRMKRMTANKKLFEGVSINVVGSTCRLSGIFCYDNRNNFTKKALTILFPFIISGKPRNIERESSKASEAELGWSAKIVRISSASLI